LPQGVPAQVWYDMSMRISFLPKKVLITGIVAAVAGGAAAVAIPVLAAHSNSAATAPATAPQDAVVGAKALRHKHLLSTVLRATVKETGLSRDTVRQRLQAGQTIDQIAGDKAQAVETDVLTALKTRLDKAVGNGKITKDREASLLASAKTRVEQLMSTSLSDLRHGKHGRNPAPTASPSAS
jgi:hypothetical protein